MTYHVTLKTREGELVEEVQSLAVDALPGVIDRGGQMFSRIQVSEGRALYLEATVLKLPVKA